MNYAPSDLPRHAQEELEAKVFFVPKAVGQPRDVRILVLNPLDEPQRDLLLGGEYVAISSQFLSTVVNFSKGLTSRHPTSGRQKEKILAHFQKEPFFGVRWPSRCSTWSLQRRPPS